MGEEGSMVYLLYPNFAKVLCDGVKQLYEKKEWVDLVVSVNGQESFVHNLMVAIFIPKLISHCESSRCELNGLNIDEKTLSILLDFVYKGQVKVERDQLKSLRRCAVKLGLKVLVDIIDKESRTHLRRKDNQPSNATKKLKAADEECVVQNEIQGDTEEISTNVVHATFATVCDNEGVNDSEFKCPHCSYQSTNLDTFTEHLSYCHQLNVDDSPLKLKFKCDLCDLVSDDKDGITLHRKQKHKKKNNLSHYKCSQCDFTADKKILIKRHLHCCHTVEKPFKCQEESCEYRGRTEKELKIHTGKQHDNVLYNCPHCNKSFVGQFNFDNHVKISHTEPDERHACQFCDFKTRYMLDLKRHQSERHNFRQHRIQKRKVYTDADLRPCSHCGMMLKSRPLLIDHLAYRHQVDLDGNPVQPSLKCKMCDYVCFAHFQLHNHVYQNHKEKQFRCEHCDYACRRRRALTAHILGKHFGQKAFMCELCGQCFSYNATLRRHLQLHESGTAFTCNSCGKIFSQKVYLDNHIKSTHTDTAVRHQCHMCAYSASTKGNLLKHIRRKHKQEDGLIIQEVNNDNEIIIQEAVLEEIIC
ncbi:hypothetical protein CHUAL_004397 [Chamberlinius hualienensis]